MAQGKSKPLHKVQIDVDEALEQSRELIEMWRDSQKQPNAPAFSGGVLDAWPAYAVDALAIADSEVARIRAYLNAEAANG